MPSTFTGVMETQRGHDFAALSVRQVDPKIHLLQAEIAPITTILMNLGKQKKADQVKTEWIERQLLPHTTTITTPGFNNSVLTINVIDPAYVKPGDFLIDRNSGEYFGPVVSSNVSTGDVVVLARGVYTSAANLVTGDKIAIIRGNIAEGGAAAEALVTLASTQYNYIEPTSTTFKVTDILEASEQYGNVDKIAELRALKMKDHMEDIEKKLLYNPRGFTTAINGVTYYSMGGLFFFIVTTVETVNVGVGGTKAFTQPQWENYILRLFKYNQSSARKTVFCSAEVLQQISEFKYQALIMRPEDPMIDVSSFSYRSQFGTVDLVHHRFLNADFNTDWYAMGLDLNHVTWMTYQPQIVRSNIQEPRLHRREDEIYTSVSMQVENEPVHGIFRVIAS